MSSILPRVALAILAIAPPSFSAPVRFLQPITYPVGHVPEAIQLGDLDGDEILDAIIANTSAFGDTALGSLSVLLGQAEGGFLTFGEFPCGHRPEDVRLAFIDGDRTLDAVTADFEGSSISLLRGDGFGGFLPAITIPAAGRPRSLLARDIDGNGTVDLATADYEGDSVTIWSGSGRGTFARASRVKVEDGPEVIAAAQVDGDDLFDLVTANARDGSISVLVAAGGGRFVARPPHRVGGAPRFIAARDLDGDGYDDLIVANHLSDAITLERNLAGEGFETVARLAAEPLSRPIYIELADLEGDGFLDILATWIGGDAFTIFGGRGGFEFGSPQIVPTGPLPIGIAALSEPGAGGMSVIVTSALEDTVSLHVSQPSATGRAFRRADLNADGDTNLTDAVWILMLLFSDGAVPECTKAADIDDNGILNVSDPINLLDYLARGGVAPPPPFAECGEDPSPDALDCEAYPPCSPESG